MAKKYQEIYSELRRDIQSHLFQNGERLPSETQMMETYGVSRQTVRHVLSLLEGDGLIRKSRGSGSFVQLTKAELNTKKIAVLFYDLDRSTFPAVIRKIDESLYKHGYTAAFYSVAGSIAKERAILQHLLSTPVDGIIIHACVVSPSCSNMDIILELRRRGTKMLFWENWYANFELSDVPVVCVENYAGPYLATEYLIQHGYKHIGGFHFTQALSFASRFSGTYNAFIKHQMEYNLDNFFKVAELDDIQIATTPEAAEILHTLDAFICPSGYGLTPLIETLRRYGTGRLRTIVVFDEVPIPQIDGVDFIVFQYAADETGELCAKKILDLINGLEVKSIQVPWKLSEETTVKDLPAEFSQIKATC